MRSIFLQVPERVLMGISLYSILLMVKSPVAKSPFNFSDSVSPSGMGALFNFTKTFSNLTLQKKLNGTVNCQNKTGGGVQCYMSVP